MYGKFVKKIGFGENAQKLRLCKQVFCATIYYSQRQRME